MSMFLDIVKISVKVGCGGDGMVVFCCEKYVFNGGLWGGDGGKGGLVIFKVNEGLWILMDFWYNCNFKVKVGEKGMIKGMYGWGVEDFIVLLLFGIIVCDVIIGKVIIDFVEYD